MALELQVTVAIVDTEPEAPGNPGILIRSLRASTLVGDSDATAANVWAVADARLSRIAEETIEDARGQIQILERDAIEKRL